MAADKLNGDFKFESSEKFEEYMKALGVGMLMRKMASKAKPTITIKIEGKHVYQKNESAVKTAILECNMDEEFDQETADGRKCKSTMKWEDDKLVLTQVWNNKTTTISRYIDPSDSDKLIITCVYNNVVCNRCFKRSK